MIVSRDRVEEVEGVEPLEGDEGEPEVGRARAVGRELLRMPISEVRRGPAIGVPPDAPVARAVELMRKKRVSAVLVVERGKGKRVVGIFTERDLVNRALPARSYARAPVSRFMTPSPETLRPKDPVAYAINKMSVGRFRHVPLVDDAGRAAGMISIRDVADLIVELCPEELLNLPPEPHLALHPTAEGD